MQEQHLYEYATIRLVPRVDREEFLNVGVVLFCKKQRYLKAHYHIDAPRLLAAFPTLDISVMEQYLAAFKNICVGGKSGGVIGSLDAPSRFRWLTATRSTVVQTSKVHPGFCTDLDAALNELFEKLVLQ